MVSGDSSTTGSGFLKQIFQYCYPTVAVGLNACALVSINEVILRRARLELESLGWVTYVPYQQPRYVTSHPGQLSLAIPPWADAISTDDGRILGNSK